MRVVISDTGPLNYLILIEHADVLALLFDTVLVPDAVRRELTRPSAPASVRTWMAASPAWLSMIRPDAGGRSADLPRLGDGEREAVLLALSFQADLILMDDRAGVAAARAKGIKVIGTLGVLDLAARRGLIDLAAAFERLRGTSFHCRPELLDAILAGHGVAP